MSKKNIPNAPNMKKIQSQALSFTSCAINYYKLKKLEFKCVSGVLRIVFSSLHFLVTFYYYRGCLRVTIAVRNQKNVAEERFYRMSNLLLTTEGSQVKNLNRRGT